jgi:hypothetical protein
MQLYLFLLFQADVNRCCELRYIHMYIYIMHIKVEDTLVYELLEQKLHSFLATPKMNLF